MLVQPQRVRKAFKLDIKKFNLKSWCALGSDLGGSRLNASFEKVIETNVNPNCQANTNCVKPERLPWVCNSKLKVFGEHQNCWLVNRNLGLPWGLTFGVQASKGSVEKIIETLLNSSVHAYVHKFVRSFVHSLVDPSFRSFLAFVRPCVPLLNHWPMFFETASMRSFCKYMCLYSTMFSGSFLIRFDVAVCLHSLLISLRRKRRCPLQRSGGIPIWNNAPRTKMICNCLRFEFKLVLSSQLLWTHTARVETPVVSRSHKNRMPNQQMHAPRPRISN